MNESELRKLARLAYSRGEEAVIDLTLSLGMQVKEAESRPNQNSTNSNFPSSRDLGTKKKNNSRVKTDRKIGGQEGHKGSTLKQSDSPDFTVECDPPDCVCGHKFNQAADFIGSCRRQVFDIPEPTVSVTEYVSRKYLCPTCNIVHSGQFPPGV